MKPRCAPSTSLPGVPLLALALLVCACDPAPDDPWATRDAAAVDAGRDAGGSDPGPGDTGGDADASDSGPSHDASTGTGHAEVLHNESGESTAYTGIGRGRTGMHCTAVFIDVDGPDGAPAYALTNGHCTGRWDDDVVFTEPELTTDPPAHVTFNYFVDTLDAQVTVPVKRVAYSTMKRTDLAVLELDSTFGALVERGATPLGLARVLPARGARVTNVGAPLASATDEVEYLRRGHCTLSGTFRLLEGEWLWLDTLENDCPDIRSGSSGSPLLDGAGRAFALLNTTVEGPEHATCYLGRPCVVTDEGTSSRGGLSYAVSIAGLHSCFAEGRFALDQPGCALEPPTAAPATQESPRYVARSKTLAGQGWTVALNAAVTSHYRFKTGPLATTHCDRAQGYGAVLAVVDAPRIEVPMGTAEGVHVLCVQHGSSASALRPVAWATAILTEVDDTPPPLPLPVLHRVEGDTATFFVAEGNPTYAGYEQKSGPEDETDCTNPEGYEFINLRFGRFSVTRGVGRTRVCVVANDFAGLKSQPQEWVLW